MLAQHIVKNGAYKGKPAWSGPAECVAGALDSAFPAS